MAEVKMPEKKVVINNDLFPSNSNVSKTHPTDDKPRQQKVISGTVKTKAPGFRKKFINMFLGEDVTDVKYYILQDVLVPTIKDTIDAIFCGGLEMLLYGKVGGRARRSSSVTPTQTYYPYGRAYSSPNVNNQTGRVSDRSRNSYDVQEIIFNTRGEADEVLSALRECLQTYDEMVSVGDLYDMTGLDTIYTDHYWGWTDLSTASVRRTRDGFVLVLPRPVSIK